MKVAEVSGAGVTLVEKRLSPRERHEPEAQAAIRAEAALLAALGGRVTPRLVESGEDFFRMEKVDLPTIAARLDAGPVTGDWLARATRAAFEALVVLHEAADPRGPLGVVHADLSPANVAADEQGARVVFFDVGLAVWRDAPRRDGAFRGTVGYVAPEVARGEIPTARSDLFSLAATLLHAATGDAPRKLPPTLPLGAAIAVAAEQPLALSRYTLTSRSLGAIARCLAHDPGARPGSAREVLRLL